MGDYGSGKTRFLQVVGALCYKSTFASGASSISPIFHMLDQFRGTLILDEADFRFSDAKSEIAKILNNGNMAGFPVLRSEVNNRGSYDPRAFHVFGPKIVATRQHYADPALESRFIYERTKAGHVRSDIPITLPADFESKALSLRNRLLMHRFQNWQSIDPHAPVELDVSAKRIVQIFRPLLVLAVDDSSKKIIASYARKSQSFLKAFRSHGAEEKILTIISELIGQKVSTLSITAVTDKYRARYGHEHIGPVTAKWVGGVVRSRLHLHTIKRSGVYVIAADDLPKLQALFERYDIPMKSTVAGRTAPSQKRSPKESA